MVQSQCEDAFTQSDMHLRNATRLTAQFQANEIPAAMTQPTMGSNGAYSAGTGTVGLARYLSDGMHRQHTRDRRRRPNWRPMA